MNSKLLSTFQKKNLFCWRLHIKRSQNIYVLETDLSGISGLTWKVQSQLGKYLCDNHLESLPRVYPFLQKRIMEPAWKIIRKCIRYFQLNN